MRLALLVLAAALSVSALSVPDASAKKSPCASRPNPGFDTTYERRCISKKPQHGYSGSPVNGFPLGPFVHCDYHRIPIRECSGSGRCKVVAWELQQFCY